MVSYHFVSSQGSRAYMEDRYVLPDERGEFFAIFDGHGGSDCAEFCATEVKELFFYELEQGVQEVHIVFRKVFSHLQQMLTDIASGSGTTATLIYIEGDWIYTANAGDSDALLWRNDSLSMLTVAHRAGLDPEETAKVKSVGGIVEGGRVNYALGVTRSLGDIDYFPAVQPYPSVSATRIRQDDKYIILATDGLWDSIAVKDVPRIVQIADGDITHMADCLAEKCHKSRDNYTIGVINLHSTADNFSEISSGGYTFSKAFQKDYHSLNT